MREHKPSQCVVARPRKTSAARAITWYHPGNDGGSEGSRLEGIAESVAVAPFAAPSAGSPWR